MRRALFAVAAIVAVPVLATAQFTHTIPLGTDVAPGNSSNAFPWGNTAAGFPGLRLLSTYESTNFTGAATPITNPILITRLKWRANETSSTWVGGTWAQATIDLSTSPVGWAAVTTTFPSNHGADQAQVYSGPVSYIAGTGNGIGVIGPVVVDITLTTPFLYDPAAGDLVIDVDYPGGTNFVANGAGTSVVSMDVQTTGSNSSRVFGSSLYPAANGTTQNHGVVVELEYVPPVGLYSSFSATPTTGASPLAVQFTDLTFTSDPGGVQTWAWDFENDGTVDSTLQNPLHTYTACGSYSVSLTTTDASNPTSTLVRTNLITTDQVDASFTTSVISPGIVQFTDTTTPTATAWAWDFENDGTIDSTLQNPVFVYPGGTGFVTASLTASRLCGPSSTTSQSLLPVTSLVTTFDGGNGLSGAGAGNVFDVQVLNPLGITVTGLVMSPWATTTTAGPVTCNVYVTDDAGGWAGTAHTDATLWRLVATGSGTAPVTSSSAPVPTNMTLSNRFHLSQGTYTLAIHMNECGVVYTTGNGTNQNFGNADVAITAGLGKGAAFNGSANNPRVWNGALLYDVCNIGGLAGYGFMGQGCAGSAGVSTLTPSGDPALGSVLSVTVDNLPLNAALMTLGLSKTSSIFGPLPVDLTSFGAPGCRGLVSPDSNTFVLGAAGSAVWNLSIPNNPSLICLGFYNQAFVLDTGFNALGGVMSDAASGMLGN